MFDCIDLLNDNYFRQRNYCCLVYYRSLSPDQYANSIQPSLNCLLCVWCVCSQVIDLVVIDDRFRCNEMPSGDLLRGLDLIWIFDASQNHTEDDIVFVTNSGPNVLDPRN